MIEPTTDSALAPLLQAAGCPLDEVALGALVEGVLAAPPAVDPDGWMALVADHPPPALRASLARLKDRIAAARGGAAGSGAVPAERLAALRAELAVRKLDGFIVPLADEHQGEFVAPRARRLAWLTGFTGSAGVAVVLADRAAIFADGRYTLQVRDQVDIASFAPHHLTESPPTDWIAANLRPGGRLGLDPWLHTVDSVTRFEAAVKRAGGLLVAVETNPVDAVWRDQPPPPLSPAVPHPERFSGESAAAKRARIAAKLTVDKVDCAVLSAPDSIAWLLNMRGGDVPNTPVALCFAMVHANGTVALFIDPRKPTRALTAALGSDVTLHPPEALGAGLDALGARRVQVDPAASPAWVIRRLERAKAEIVRAADPCALPKSCKNPVELEGVRAAHLRDGAALTRFLAWLAGAAPGGGVSEISAAERLYGFRRAGALFRGVSFATISAAGASGAVVHYQADARSDRPLAGGMVYLVDSGAQYLDGTTDVTRTLWIAGGAAPPDELRDRFTRVLKGHIALATVRFPAGTTGAQLDALARTALWAAGLDYDHGTGHGVGSYLGVHEGPARISKLPSSVALAPGMILSDEPGYYKAGAYGIRIENLLAVRQPDRPMGAESDMLSFETLTLAPIDRALVDPRLLTAAETDWLNAYHARVRDALTPLVDADTAAWLAGATAPV